LRQTPPCPRPRSMPLELHTSTRLHVYVRTPAAPTARVESSIPLHLHVYTPERTQSSGARYLCTSASTHLQHASRASELDVSFEATPVAHLQRSGTPYLYASMSARLQPVSTFLPPRRCTYSVPPELHTSTSLRLHTPPELQSFIPLLRQRLQRTSRPLLRQRPYACSTPPDLHLLRRRRRRQSASSSCCGRSRRRP